MPTLRTGDTGPLVLRLQFLLSYQKYLNANDMDGVFGSATETAVRSFQADQGLKVDGIAGERTWLVLSAGIETPPTLSLGATGESVARLQRALNDLRDLRSSPAPLEIDGIFGPRTEQMVKAWQASEGVPVDGIVGPRTWSTSVHAAGATLATLVGPTIPRERPPAGPQDGPPAGSGSGGGAAPSSPAIPASRDEPSWNPGAPSVPSRDAESGRVVRGGEPGRALPAGLPQRSVRGRPSQSVAYDELVRRAFAEMVQPGRLLFNPPNRMQLSQVERVEVRLARTLELDSELLQDLRGHGEPRLEKIPTAPLMAVTLKGDKFRIEALSDEEQSVSQDRITSWEFDIRALERGRQRLVMCVSLRIPVPGESAQHMSIPVREATIDVQVGTPALVGRFVAANWQWFVGTAVAIAAVIVTVLFH
jgi:peptidoglycan hydrolase-like protein with peptidoglycan-binding domain